MGRIKKPEYLKDSQNFNESQKLKLKLKTKLR